MAQTLIAYCWSIHQIKRFDTRSFTWLLNKRATRIKFLIHLYKIYMKKVIGGILLFLVGITAGFWFFSPATHGILKGGGGNSQRSSPALRYVLTSNVTTTVGNTMNVADYQFIGWTVVTQSASDTLKFACSMADSAPNFAQTASVTNTWGYVNVTDLDTEGSIGGSSGLVFINSSTVRQLQSRNANYRWCTVNESSWTVGTTTVSILPVTNQ